MDALMVPALKSRAKLTRSLPRPGKDGCVIFSNAINPREGWRIFPRRASDGFGSCFRDQLRKKLLRLTDHRCSRFYMAVVNACTVPQIAPLSRKRNRKPLYN
jgi:hypothetical protein